MTIPQFTAGQVLTAAELNAMVDAINAGGGKMEVTAFTASGTFTVPAGVTYAIAHITGGGGGVGTSGAAPGQGGTSSVAFAGGTVSATGGLGVITQSSISLNAGVAGQNNSGHGAKRVGTDLGSDAFDGTHIVAGGAVTPAASITITVGAGGTAGGGVSAAGGSGYIWIEYQV